jgi:hypothetical protein
VIARHLTTLRAALGFLQLPPRAPELRLLHVSARRARPSLGLVHRWLESWTGVGLIAMAAQRQGWDLQLTSYGRSNVYVTGMAH